MKFIFLVFAITFLSDIILNDLSKHYITSLRPYFYNQSIIKCAFDASLTVLIGLAITMAISYVVLGFSSPTTFKTLLYFCGIAFVIGYILDKLIYKLHIFGDRLTLYYKTYGSGLWGALAFIFAIASSYVINKYVIL
jgi:uncharacterized membrane protein